MTSRDEHLMTGIGRLNWFVLGAMVLVSLAWQSLSVTLGVVAGGLLVILNFSWMGHSLLRVIDTSQTFSTRGFKRNYFLRLLVVGSVIYLLLVRGGVEPLALVVGLSVVVVSLLLTTIRRLY